jgi:hypothetical protein
MSGMQLNYNVSALRSVGFEAKWIKNSAGAPIIAARKRGSTGPLFYVTKQMWERSKIVGIVQAFEEFEVLGLATKL